MAPGAVLSECVCAPLRIACIPTASSVPVRTTIGVCAFGDTTRRRVSKPVRSGKFKSKRTRSMPPWLKHRKASAVSWLAL